MIYEIAQLPVFKGHIETFRQAFAEAVPLLCCAQGWMSAAMRITHRAEEKPIWRWY
jgi:heme-degrading monooxygenase HmoA